MGADVPAESVLNNIPDDYCRKYQLGSCHRGTSCRWKHIIWKGAAAASGAPAAAAAASAPAAKRAKLSQPAAAPAVAAIPIGGVGQEGGNVSAAELAKALREKLERREASWRSQHPEHEGGVPDEPKNRDVVWRALERQLRRAEALIEAEAP